MNRRERRATRTQARQRTPKPVTLEDQLHRQHLLACNMAEVERVAALTEPGAVVVVSDTRDPVGRGMIMALRGMSEAEMRAWEAPFLLAKVIPTVVTSIPRDIAIDATAEHAPSTSELIEQLTPEAGVCVLVIARGGTLSALIPR